MSKMDALRAMREARYAQGQARAAQGGAAPRRPTPVAPAPAAESSGTAEPDVDSSGLCGHRSISGRTCTREKGHTAKNHRYS